MDAYWTDSANEMIAFLDPDNERQLHILKGDLIGLRNALKGTNSIRWRTASLQR